MVMGAACRGIGAITFTAAPCGGAITGVPCGGIGAVKTTCWVGSATEAPDTPADAATAEAASIEELGAAISRDWWA